MVEQLRALATSVEAPKFSSQRPHTGSTVSNSSSKTSPTLFWSLLALHTHASLNVQTKHSQTQNKISQSLVLNVKHMFQGLFGGQRTAF